MTVVQSAENVLLIRHGAAGVEGTSFLIDLLVVADVVASIGGAGVHVLGIE